MQKLNWFDHIKINLFWLGLNIRNNAIGVIFMPYLVDAFVRPEIRNTALGEMRTAGLIIAMLVQPAMGYLSDRSTSRFGRRRPFIFIGVLLDILFLALMVLSTNYWMLLAAILLVQFSSNISHGALQGLIPDLVPEKQQGVSSGVKAVMELLPLVLLAFTIAPLVGAGELGWGVILTCGMLFLTMLLTMVLVKEKPLTDKPTTPLAPAMLRVLGMLAGIGIGAVAGLAGGALSGGLVGLILWPFAGVVTARAGAIGFGGIAAMVIAVIAGVYAGVRATLGKAAAEKRSFTAWVINRLLFLTAVTSIQVFAPYFLMYVFDISSEDAVATTGRLMMVVGLLTLASAVPSGWLSDRFGHKRLVGLSGVIAALGSFLLLATIWMPNMTLIFIAGGILGVAAGLFTTTNWALGCTLVPPEEAGRYMGISNLAGAGAGMIGTGLGGPVADLLNGIFPGLGYFVLFIGYGILFLLSTISLRWVKISSV